MTAPTTATPAPTVPYATPAGSGAQVPATPGQPLLEVRNLQTWFPIRKGLLSRTVGHVKAVDYVSFAVHPGRTLGLGG